MSLYSLYVYKTVFLEDFCPLGCYAAYVDSCLPTFRDCLSALSRRVRSPSCLTLADRIFRLFQNFDKNNQHRLCNIPEERRTQLHRGEACYLALRFLFICVRNVCWVFLFWWRVLNHYFINICQFKVLWSMILFFVLLNIVMQIRGSWQTCGIICSTSVLCCGCRGAACKDSVHLFAAVTEPRLSGFLT